ncbi:MAG UNVERIFIED_CONTAM: hypothetical protein LVQ98_08590 [Rickettsiaceae bacterium]|jgi:hypothetical protein
MTQLTHSAFKSAPPIISLSGNIVPHSWYQLIVNKSGVPDNVAISIFSEIIYWYRPSKEGRAKFNGNAWQTSYSHFEEKFRYYHEKVRRALVRLEELELIKREFRAVDHFGQKYPNRLFIHLTGNALKLISAEESISSQGKIENNISESLFQKAFSNEKEIILPGFVDLSPQIRGDYISKEENIEINRSMDLESSDPKSESKSNFLFSCFKEREKKEGRGVSELSSKTLHDFLPLSEKDVDLLQVMSGRSFNLNAMNEILYNMALRLEDREFKSKKAFLNYASKALANEMREATKINNEGFRIRANYSEEELVEKDYNEYLDKIETSLDTSPIAILQKKLVSCFEAKRAYEVTRAIGSVCRVGGEVILHLIKALNLSDYERSTITSKVIETYFYDAPNNIDPGCVKISMPEMDESCWTEKSYSLIDKQNSFIPVNSKIKHEKPNNLPCNVWGKVRGELIKRFGNDVDKAWFSRLVPQIDEDSKNLHIKAPTEFIRNWIENNYGATMQKVAKNLGFELTSICSSGTYNLI